MKSSTTIALIAVLAMGLCVTSSAADKVRDVSTAAIIGPETEVREAPLVAENWGFESGEGFTPGFIASQVGWTAFSASLVEGHIDTANPYTGTQNLRISLDAAVAAGTIVGAFSPVVADTVVDASSVQVYVNIGATGGADYDVVPQSPTQAMLTARVNFSYLGDINVLDDVGAGLAFEDTGADWVPGVYTLLQIDVDPVGNTIDYYYGGALIYSSVAGIVAATIVEQVVLLSDNWNVTESGDFDDLMIERGDVPVELQVISVN